MEYSVTNLQRLFTSSGGNRRSPRESYIRLSFCLSQGLVRVQQFSYNRAIPPTEAHSSDYRDYRDYRQIIESSRIENLDHRNLKWDAYAWCLERTGHRPEIEAGAVDLVERTTGTWIECGDSSPEFAFRIFFLDHGGHRKANWQRFVLFPREQGIESLLRMMDVPLRYGPRAFVFEPTERGREIIPMHIAWEDRWLYWAKRRRSEPDFPIPDPVSDEISLGCSTPPIKKADATLF